MANFFRLDSDCFLIEGARDAALYDVTGGRFYLLDEEARAALRKCESNSPIDCSCQQERDRMFLEFLCAEGLGFFYDSPVYVDKFVAPAKLRLFDQPLVRPQYRFVDWTITQSCDVNCSHCPAEPDGLSWQTCLTCLRKPAVTENTEIFEHTSDIVEQIAELGISRLHIRGGNPLMAWDRLISIIREAERYPKLIVIVTTPGTGCSINDLVELCSRPHVRLNLTLFAVDVQAAKSSCGEEVMAYQFALLRELTQHKVRFSVTLLLNGRTCRRREVSSNFLSENWHRKPRIAEIYTAKEAQAGVSFSHIRSRGRLLSCWRSRDELYARAFFSTCLFARFQINFDGSVSPCAAIGDHCGQIVGGDLRAALKGETLYDWWAFSKRDVQPCSKCALRYLCLDCAAAEVKCKKENSSGAHFCSFNPEGTVRAFQIHWDHAGFAKFAITGPTVEDICQTL